MAHHRTHAFSSADLDALVQQVYTIVDTARPDPVNNSSTRLGYVTSGIKTAITQYGATPQAIANYIIGLIDRDGWTSRALSNEGADTLLAQQFAPHTQHPKPPFDVANALASGNVAQAQQGKSFLGLDGTTHYPGEPGYNAAKVALLAGVPPPAPAPTPGWDGTERRVGPAERRAAKVAPGTGGVGIG